MSRARLAALRQRHHAARALAEACLAALSATAGEGDGTALRRSDRIARRQPRRRRAADIAAAPR